MFEVPYIRRAVEVAANALMDAEATAQTNAAYYQRSGTRTAYRNGYRIRRWQTPFGELTLHIPKLRQGTYYPAFLDMDDAPEQLAALAWDALTGEPDADAIRSLLADPADDTTLARVLDVLTSTAADHLTRRIHGVYPRLTVTNADGWRVIYGERADGEAHLLGLLADADDSEAVVRSLLERGLHGVRELDGDGLTPGLRRALWRALPATGRTQRVTLALGNPLAAPSFRDDTPRLLLETAADAALEVRVRAAHLRAVRRMLRRETDAVGVVLDAA